MKHKISIDCECQCCNGTGVYVGFAEHDGAAVVCKYCNGTGKANIKFEYNDFEGKKTRKGIKRVYKHNPGISIGISKKNDKIDLEYFGGMSYHDWFRGKEFPMSSEMRNSTCPRWYFQSIDYKKCSNWDECGFGIFSECKCFKNKEKCWDRFDKEQKA